MKIVHLVAGAGDMYCGSCLQGSTLAAALRQAGRDVLLVPFYTPLRTEEEAANGDRVAFGGVNVYLQQCSVPFRHTPWLVDRLSDRPAGLRWLSKRGGSTRPERLGPLTVSVLQGETGRQRKELRRLVDWLRREVRPDLVHLSNAMLSGTARELTARLNVPVVCTLSGEDAFIEQLPEPYYSKARAVLRERAADLAALVAPNRYYADFMADYLSVSRDRIHVIPPGINLAGHGTRENTPEPDRPRGAPVTIGYLSRICPEKGLHLLAEAFKLLARDKDVPPLRLLAGGYMDRADRWYLDKIRTQLDDWGLGERFRYVGELDRAAKIAFLQKLDVMSVPAVYPQSKGLPILEAWANAVPVVLPRHGAFGELVDDTGGGLLCRPGSPPALAAALKQLILDPAFAARCGRKARAAVHARYHAPLMAERTMALYDTLRNDHHANRPTRVTA